MAQKSFSWPRGVAVDSMVGYTATEWSGIWAEMMQAGGVIKIAPNLRTVAAFANIGVFYSVDNKLEASTPGNNSVDVDTGAAMVCGHAFYNDTIISDATITDGPRDDIVVVRCNFTAAAYVPPNASAALFTVPAYTARITIIEDIEFSQDQTLATYWDIPLASYTISNVGAISAWLDLREWADAEKKSLYVFPSAGRDDTSPIDILHGALAGDFGLIFQDAVLSHATDWFIVPDDFISGFVVQAISETSVGGNIYAGLQCTYQAIGEALGTHTTGAIAYTAVAMSGGNVLDATHIQTLANASAGDTVCCRFARDATDPLDTIVGGLVQFYGFHAQYLGWR